MPAGASRRGVLLGLLGLGAVAALGGPPLVGVRRVRPQETPSDDLLDDWGAVLEAVVVDGRVRWELLVDGPLRERLERVCARFAVWGPRTAPEEVAGPQDELAYLIDAYNALVLLGVVRSWPIASVDDVQGPVQPVPHFGFFYGLRFRLDGDWLSLYELEHGRIFDLSDDARVHAAINCASASCPPLRSQPFLGSPLDARLDAATRAWMRAPGSVRLDEDSRRVVFPPLYAFYPDDFGAHARREGWGDDWTHFALHWLEPDRAAAVRERLDQGWEAHRPDYDWSLNQAPGSEPRPTSRPR